MSLARLRVRFLERWSQAPRVQAPLLSTDEVLREEAAAINGVNGAESICRQTDGPLYHALNHLNSAALCLSGGGIRSAAFALGVVQALATHPRPRPGDPVALPEHSLLARFQYLSTVSGGGYIGSWLSAWLARSEGFEAVWCNLIRRARPDHEADELGWLRSYSNYLTPRLGVTSADTWAIVSVYLRNLLLNWLVLLPAIGAGILALKAFVVLLSGFSNFEHLLQPRLAVAGAGVLFLLIALRFTTRYRPSRLIRRLAPIRFEERRRKKAGSKRLVRTTGASPDGWFFRNSLFWSLLSAIALTQYLGISDVSDSTVLAYVRNAAVVSGNSAFAWFIDTYRTLVIVGVGALGGALIYALAWILGWPHWVWRWPCIVARRPRLHELGDFTRWATSGLVYGALVAMGFCLYLRIPADNGSGFIEFLNNPATYLIIGVPWILLAQWSADMVFIGLSSYRSRFNVDQEWLGRAAGWLLVTAVVWSLGLFVTFAGFLSALDAKSGVSFYRLMAYVLVPISIVTGLVIALVGTNSLSRFSTGRGFLPYLSNLFLALAAPLFIGALVFTLSIALDRLLFGRHLFDSQFRDMISDVRSNPVAYTQWKSTLRQLFAALLVTGGIAALASYLININLFSLHALYRNRLIRAFLGASNQRRNPDQFTGFDPKDDPPMHKLWPKPGANGDWPRRWPGDWRPFHILNLTLNIVSSSHLAWQERKAAPFTVSPLHCGTSIKTNGPVEQRQKRSTASSEVFAAPTASSYGAYRPSTKYGGPNGISLGTAMAISGAAANPNMGYHTSPSVTLLMTMFNVRLGWWLGNPGHEGKRTFMRDGPEFAIHPLFEETFGLTTDTSAYIHLSDGGHFENLGLYEMVRRRCRLIVISDVGRDPSYAFEDLGNAVRRISIDLGIRIEFHKLEMLKRRPVDGSDIGTDREYHAIADIHYKEADGDCVEDGLILYIKAGYHGSESAGVRSYAMANLDFPHQSTADQWFSESQFESYRSLGFEIMEDMLDRAFKHEPYATEPTLDNLLITLRSKAIGSITGRAVMQSEQEATA